MKQPSNAVTQRIASLPSVEASATILDVEEVTAFINGVDMIRSTGRLVEQNDISHTDRDAVQSLLSSWLAQSERCTVVWPWDRVGCELDSNEFIAHYDDLWYPSSDDMWIGWKGSELLIQLNHEEVAELWGPGADSDR
jgi:hypothetical protein